MLQSRGWAPVSARRYAGSSRDVRAGALPRRALERRTMRETHARDFFDDDRPAALQMPGLQATLRDLLVGSVTELRGGTLMGLAADLRVYVDTQSTKVSAGTSLFQNAIPETTGR